MSTGPFVPVDDDALAYGALRTDFAVHKRLKFDPAYRLAHLPLVAPDHPGVIAMKSGTSYAHGRHAEAFSLVLPIPIEALEASPGYQAMHAALRAAPFAAKLAWDILPRRRERLHATLAGLGEETLPEIAPKTREALRQIGPFEVELRGIFSGNLNLGRLYAKLYPEARAGQNAIHLVQDALGSKRSDLYLVGLHNFIEEPNEAETAALAGIIEAFWNRPLLHFRVDALWLLGARDDLVLESRVIEAIPLRQDGAPSP